MQLRNVLLMLVLAIVSLAAFLAIRGGGSGPGVGALPTVFPSFDRSSVSRFEIALKSGESAVLRRKPGASDRWEMLEKTEWVPANAPQVDDLLLALTQQSVVSRLPADEELDRGEFSLVEPEATAKLEMPGETIDLRYGRQTPGGSSVYVDSGDGTDVYVVDGGGVAELRAGLLNGLASLELFGGETSTFDIGKLEVFRGGAEKPDVVVEREDGVWKVRVPFAGYAQPSPFERVLGGMVVAQVKKWLYGEVDLAKYGLDAPRARVVITKRDGERQVALLGSPVDAQHPEGDAYVALDGTRNVAIVDGRWVRNALADPKSYRDRAFTRLGIDGKRILARFGEKHFELQKVSAQWDVTEPIRREPADGEYVEQVLESLRSWAILEFEDELEPTEVEVGEHGVIEIERNSGGLIQLRIGTAVDDGAIHAQRFVDGQPDGPVVVVTRGIVEMLREGHEPFLSKSVRKVILEDLEEIRRHAPEGHDITGFKLAVKNPNDKSLRLWENAGPGEIGVVDQTAVSELLAPLADLRTLRWIAYDHSAQQREGLGFDVTQDGWGRWMTIEFSYNEVGKSNVGGQDQVLLIGNIAPGGGRYARFKSSPDDPKYNYAFVLADDVVARLQAPVFKLQ